MLTYRGEEAECGGHCTGGDGRGESFNRPHAERQYEKQVLELEDFKGKTEALLRYYTAHIEIVGPTPTFTDDRA